MYKNQEFKVKVLSERQEGSDRTTTKEEFFSLNDVGLMRAARSRLKSNLIDKSQLSNKKLKFVES
ncbi:hypothetical protein ACP3TC_06170 [Winslowiella sp. 2C04]|uniref:hypothetical protein n=1 Tax=Winslowiella sp. 2C04 TaxID=3416179 RepID=UPI003CFAE607